MKVSELSVDDFVKYARLEDVREFDGDVNLQNYLDAAKSYVKNYAALTDEIMDKNEEISLAVLAVANDMYANRLHSATYNNAYLNKLISAIVGMHSRNLI